MTEMLILPWKTMAARDMAKAVFDRRERELRDKRQDQALQYTCRAFEQMSQMAQESWIRSYLPMVDVLIPVLQSHLTAQLMDEKDQAQAVPGDYLDGVRDAFNTSIAVIEQLAND